MTRKMICEWRGCASEHVLSLNEMEIDFSKCKSLFGCRVKSGTLSTEGNSKTGKIWKLRKNFNFKLFTWWRILKLHFFTLGSIFCYWFLSHIWIKFNCSIQIWLKISPWCCRRTSYPRLGLRQGILGLPDSAFSVHRWLLVS